MKTIIKSFFIFFLFFLLSLPVVAFANHIALTVLQKQPYQSVQVEGTNVTPMPTPNIRNGDADMDNQITIADVNYISVNWDHSASGSIDQYQDGKINTFDFAVTAIKLNQ